MHSDGSISTVRSPASFPPVKWDKAPIPANPPSWSKTRCRLGCDRIEMPLGSGFSTIQCAGPRLGCGRSRLKRPPMSLACQDCARHPRKPSAPSGQRSDDPLRRSRTRNRELDRARKSRSAPLWRAYPHRPRRSASRHTRQSAGRSGVWDRHDRAGSRLWCRADGTSLYGRRCHDGPGQRRGYAWGPRCSEGTAWGGRGRGELVASQSGRPKPNSRVRLV